MNNVEHITHNTQKVPSDSFHYDESQVGIRRKTLMLCG